MSAVEHGDVGFGANYALAGVRLKADSLFGGLVLDFNVGDPGNSPPGTLPNVIRFNQYLTSA